MEYEFKIPGGSLFYQKIKETKEEMSICITSFHGLTGEVEIPKEIEGCPVRYIAKKAFLSKKNLRKVILPADVTDVGDWAFAYCDNLHTVIFNVSGERDEDYGVSQAEENAMRQDMRFGRAVFLECNNLKFLYVNEEGETAAALLAAAVTVAGAPYLLDAVETGKREWLEKWDARMMSVLHSEDNEGYSKQVLCGEEDYGSTDLAAYESGRRKIKVRLLLLRLLYPKSLSEEHRKEMEEYLRNHTKGCIHEETWEVVLNEYGDDRNYYRLFADLNCVNKENIEGILTDIGENYPEMKAFFLRYGGNGGYGEDFFAALEL